jgi:hypothetical protein
LIKVLTPALARSRLSRLAHLGITLVFALACVGMVVGITWWPRSDAPQVRAAGCPYLGFSPTSGYIGMRVTISGALSCYQGSDGKTATIFVVPGNNTTDPTICASATPEVDVGTVTVIANQYSSLTFTWPSQAAQLGNWSACAKVPGVSGTNVNTQGTNLFQVVAAPTPAVTPLPTPTSAAALPTATTAATIAAATATPTPLPKATATAVLRPTTSPTAANSSQRSIPPSGKPLPWGLVLGGVGAVGGAGLLSLGGALFFRRRRLRQ